MKKSLAVLLFLVAGTFLCGNALALDTYIPHITAGANDWTDYLQVNNNASSTTTFTLTLYGSTGAQVYSQSQSVGGRSRSQIQLKALNSSAASGRITYTETGLVFRVSYENLGGGVAEFETIDTLGSTIGFYFSDFSSLVQWKGMAIANMGATNADVTFYALGGSSSGSGGSILASHTETITPGTKIVGDNFNLSWLSGLARSSIESIIAVTASSSLCGIAVSGDAAASRLLFTPAAMVSNFNPISAPVTVDVSIGDFFFAPQSVTIKVGDTVRWTNNGAAPHTTTSGTSPTGDGKWASGILSSGQSFSFTFTQAGTFPYFCAVHPFMIGTVTVQ
jgi:plastocyanin